MGQTIARQPRERQAATTSLRTALWYGVHLPHLGLEIFERRYPDERVRPTVLMDGKEVSLMNSLARDAGIAPGSAEVQLAFRVPPPAVDRCHAERPKLRPVGEGLAACHRAEEIASSGGETEE